MTDDLSFLVESVVWRPDSLWNDAVKHIATRFSRVRQLSDPALADPEGLDPLALPIASLDAWAGDDIDWRRELARYFDEHLSMHVRPSAPVARALRSAGSSATLIAVTRLPDAAARSLLLHAGVSRAVAEVRSLVPTRPLPSVMARSLDELTRPDAPA